MSNNKIIMVNSFKGGAGKTSIALSLCTTAAYKDCETEIFYIDLDILGTAANYAIFNKDKTICYMSLEAEKIAENKVKFDYGEKKLQFNACLIHPENRLTSNHVANLNQRSNANCLHGIFAKKISSYIDNILKNKKDTLIVLDCSPGLSEFEKLILENLYHKQNSENMCNIYEIYVTTLDVSHIKKTIESMKTVCTGNPNLDKRNIKIITNDLVDLKELLKETDTKKETYIDTDQYTVGLNTYIKAQINKLFNTDENKIVDEVISVLFNKYNQNLIKSNILFHTVDMSKEDTVPLEMDAEPYYNNSLYDEVIKGGAK
ncbi:nucleotide-binding protein [Clostridium tagluense]|uniref:nucleotide-binding protein n=1 Tax=Clostridium tagluense TaxID=360422 RepID=UPI001C0D9973|nr:AAA family ATPase [Clostridium tagluense]MBU3126234.1 ParA family protein [Clostridium tagluense]